MPAPDTIRQLVERFDEQKDIYKTASYNETQVRRDFIDPFFAALGWDVDNTKGYAEAYRDVIHEDKVLVGKTKKAPDYSFRVGGTRKFFVEAKKPSVPIKLNPEPAFQVRRYGWSADLPVCIVTDFEEFAVYDTTIKPKDTDPPSKARLFYCTYDEYPDKWDEISELFSQEAILRGAFDRFNKKKRKGTETVDVAFLEEIEQWRLALAKNIHKHNTDLTTHNLNSAVQTIIDRIVFLRICEDRGIEQEDRLKKLVGKKDVYKKLVKQFKDADAKYNSGLFHFSQEKGRNTEVDDLTPHLEISDYVLTGIFESLYFPAPYEFSVLPPDILGSVYERFLGKVITLDENGVEIEEKPEVRKAGGVYYTPGYIVDYIVKNTVGELLEGKTPTQIEKLRVVDPACGSGSFLIVAYQYLLDWHLAFYMTHKDNKNKAKNYRIKQRIYQSDKGVWKLSIGERKRILLNSIYGVDIDKQAVEVTKLSLLLKVLEGESRDTVESQMSLFKERALPDLGDNIQCGNSLIGSDFYAQEDLPKLTEEEHQRLNVFDWEDAFPEVFKAGGFDAVIGNPPYLSYSSRNSILAFYRNEGLTELLRISQAQVDFAATKYLNTSSGVKDLYKWFTEKAVYLLKKHGKLGFIMPETWLKQSGYADLRSFLRTKIGGYHFVRCGFDVFIPQATVPAGILLLKKRQSSTMVGVNTSNSTVLPEWENSKKQTLYASLIKSTTNTTLGRLISIREGQHIPRKCLYAQPTEKSLPVIDSRQMARYMFGSTNCYFDAISNYKSTTGHRVIIRKTGDFICASITPKEPSYVIQNLYQVIDFGNYPPFLILGLLNSNLLTYCYRESEYGQKGRTMAQFRKSGLDSLPVPKKISRAHSLDIEKTAIELHNSTQPPIQIKGLEKKINTLVYRLYGLTEEEIRVVEESM